MKLKKMALIALLSVNFLCYSQENVIELPLTVQNGYGPFSVTFSGIPTISEDESNPWKNTYLKISKFTEGLTDVKYGNIDLNHRQSAYQDYFLGNITEQWYEALHKLWDWIPDTSNLSKSPLKTKIAFMYGKDSEGILKFAVDTNNNLDLSDDELFTPFEITPSFDWSKVDSLAKIYAVNVSYESFVHNKIVPISAPLFFIYSKTENIFGCNLFQYSTTQYNGEQIAVAANDFMDLYHPNIRVTIERRELKNGAIIKSDDIYRKNQNIIIKDEVYKIIGVNTNKNTLVLEKTDLSKRQFFSANVGHKPYPFKGEEFTTKAAISLESLKGKYVFLDFWADSCIPCIKEFPNLKELYSKTDRAKFEIVGIAGDSSSNGVKKLIDQYEITWPQLFSDNTNKIIETYGVNSYPTTLLLDTEGVIIAKTLKGKELEEKILSLITE